MQTNSIILTPEQDHALSLILSWIPTDEQEFRLGGYAGTGKTTILKSLIAQLRIPYAVCAFTGKAVHVLQRKGLRMSQTMHSLMYTVEVLKGGGVQFHLRGSLEGDIKLVIVDEASMISSELYQDLKSFGVKLLFVGDPGQLEPVGDNPNLMKVCDYVLSKIHRQAENSPIISLATRIRGGATPKKEVSVCGNLIIRGKDLNSELLLGVDQVICARNKTRQTLNERFRQHFKYPFASIVAGDKLICLRNKPDFGLFNGMILWVVAITNETNQCWMVTFKDEFDKRFTQIPVWKDPFRRELSKGELCPRIYAHFDYGYAITCHKSQGSEWDKVLVYDEWLPPALWDMARWRYTAVTRAATKLIYCI